jgi:hypothetical protein
MADKGTTQTREYFAAWRPLAPETCAIIPKEDAAFLTGIENSSLPARDAHIPGCEPAHQRGPEGYLALHFLGHTLPVLSVASNEV